MRMRIFGILFLVFFLCSEKMFPDFLITIKDGNTQEALAFANIGIKNNCTGTDSSATKAFATTDINGKIKVVQEQTICVVFSYLGYAEKHFQINSDTTLFVNPDEKKIQEITVTGTFKPTAIREALYDVKILTDERLKVKGTTDLRDALNTELLFKTNNGHVNETALTLNGLSGNHVKYMIDGVPIEGRLNGNIDLSQINLNNIERIEIIEGPTSVAYGTNALGGAINIITKKHLQKKWNVQLNGYYETVGQYNFSVAGGYRFKNNTFKISFGRNFFSGYSFYDTARSKTWKPREQYFGSFACIKSLKLLQFSYIVDGFYEKMLSRGEPNPPYFITAFDTYYKTLRVNNKILLTGKLSRDKNIDIALSHAYFLRVRNIYFKDLTALTYFPSDGESDQDTTRIHALMLRGVFAQKFDSIRISYKSGMEIKYDFISALRVYNQRQHLGDYAFFASMEYKPVQQLKLNPAFRISYNTAYKFSFTPSFHLQYKFHPDWKLKISYARGYRAPDLKELYLEFHYNSTINLYGNAGLKPETSHHINALLELDKNFKTHHLKLTSKFYFTKIKNLIGLVQLSPIDWKYTNSDYYTVYGGAIQAQYGYKFLTLTGAYNFNSTYNSIFNRNGFNNHFFFNHNVTSSVAFNYEKYGVGANLDYRFSGEIKNYYLNDLDEIKDSRIGAYHILNLSANKTLFNKRLLFVLGVKNLLNVKSVDYIGDVANVSNQSDAKILNVLWGRTFFMSFNINL